MHLFNHYKERIVIDDNLGTKWVHNKICKELSAFNVDGVTSSNRFKAFLFRFGFMPFCYRVMGKLKKESNLFCEKNDIIKKFFYI